MSEETRTHIQAASPALDTEGGAISNVLVPTDKKSTWPFEENNDKYIKADVFMSNVYLGDGDKKPWLTNTAAREFEQWMVTRIGSENLRPVNNEPVGYLKNPAWEWAEIWRALNTYKILTTRKRVDRPVANFLYSSRGSNIGSAMFPDDINNLLRANEEVIMKSKDDWIGRRATNLPVGSFAGVQAAYAKGLEFFQAGAIGPMSIEAAFILATQLAGVDWTKVVPRITYEDTERGIYWVSALNITPPGGEAPIKEYRKRPLLDRDHGLRYALQNASPDNNVEAGMVLALDLDPDIDVTKCPTKNVFIFAVHAIDAHSRVYVPDVKQLTRLTYTKYDPHTQTAISTRADADGIRFYGHAHAAIMRHQEWSKWVGEVHKGDPMPKYSQIGEHHFYILTENEDPMWPRAQCLFPPKV